MSARAPLTVLFRVAAGPRLGFGHLARSRVLARELGTPLYVSLRGTHRTAGVARAFGARVIAGGLTALDRLKPRLVVVDDPDTVAGARWVAGARRKGVPVASIHDGAERHADADLVVDGSVMAAPDRRRRRLRGQDAMALTLYGPDYAVIDIAGGGAARNVVREPGRVIVALGGGSHVRALAGPIAAAIGRHAPRARVVIAAGFSTGARPALPSNAEWIDVPRGLAAELSRASVAVIAGGITLYEAAALATPIVTFAIVPAQRRATRAFARRAAAIDAGLSGPGAIERVGTHVAVLLTDLSRARGLASAAHRIVDGGGAARVASHLRSLARCAGDHRHAA